MSKYSLGRGLLFRFLRGAIAGAVSAMLIVNVSGTNTFADLKIFFTALVYSGLIGFVTGGLMTVDKYIRSK